MDMIQRNMIDRNWDPDTHAILGGRDVTLRWKWVVGWLDGEDWDG